VQIITRLIPLHPRNVFRISRAARHEAVNVFLRIERDGIVGHGEASANAYYGENAADVARRLGVLCGFLEGRPIDSPADIEAVWRDAWPLLTPSRAAQCALDVALWDWLGKRMGLTATDLALGLKPEPVASFATVGISDNGELDRKIAELAGFPLIKIKSDATADLSAARRIRGAMPEARLAIDANCAWAEVDLGRVATELRAIGVEFVEQPLPPSADARMPAICAALPAPVLADESCITIEDIERMPGNFAGFNIKLVKCGGLSPALRMVRRGRELGLETMVGCMLESSVLIAAGAVIAQITDYADLDGAWLLADDPARGWGFDRGRLYPEPAPGLGVEI
jgi:L-alanine-DL-glutamate epimerase-like enolase superfamily enzyme